MSCVNFLDCYNQPFVIFGGFTSFPVVYAGLRRTLSRLTSQPTSIVPIQSYEWLLAVRQAGWSSILKKLDRTVNELVNKSPSGKVTLVGHSIGGVVSRLYLSDSPFRGRIYSGLDYVDHLITLGSPHINHGGLTRGGHVSRAINAQVPGAAYFPHVRYTSVAGKWLRGTRFGPRLARIVYDLYDSIGGDGTAWGDGLVPLESAILPGSHPVILEGVSHYTIFGKTWFGNEDVVPRWLEAAAN
ncbi:MAG: hypothetical protein PVF74_11845 [Anaerolineales bacterium]|jgi:hypothetical protein